MNDRYIALLKKLLHRAFPPVLRKFQFGGQNWPIRHHNLEAFRKFKHNEINAARAVPSTVGGGDNRHIFLLESVTWNGLHRSHAPGRHRLYRGNQQRPDRVRQGDARDGPGDLHHAGARARRPLQDQHRQCPRQAARPARRRGVRVRRGRVSMPRRSRPPATHHLRSTQLSRLPRSLPSPKRRSPTSAAAMASPPASPR